MSTPMTDRSAATLHALEGIHAPVHDELEVDELEVEGAIPTPLRGTFLRNGPNPMFPPEGEYHLFDGDGMLHAVDLADGTARYRNRWVRSRGLGAEIAAGRALYGGMANASFPGRDLVGDAGPVKNVANTGIVRHADRLLCLWEAGPPTEVADDLSTLGTTDLGGLVGPMTAHPKIDPDSGVMYGFGYSAMPPYLRYHVVSAGGQLERTIEIDLPAPVMMHDFAITATRAVFLDAPALFDFTGFGAGGPMLRWAPELGTRIGVMDRDGDGSDLRWYPVEDCFVFHFLNAYDDGDLLVVDACRLPHLELSLGSDAAASPPSHLGRFELTPSTGTVAWQQVAEAPGDFPRIDDRRTGRPHRTGYLAAVVGDDPTRPGGHFDSVVAHDLHEDRVQVHRFGDDEVCGEPVFAPDPAGSGERDGWLLVHVGDRSGTRSDVVVLDAASIEDPPVARIRMPRRVPFGFHGNWLPTV